MNYNALFLFTFVLLNFSDYSLDGVHPSIEVETKSQEYQRHPCIPENSWDEAKPYFLPNSHPIKHRLDHLFSQVRLLNSLDSIQLAGFKMIKAKGKLHVASHPKLPGYLIKFYLDDHDNKPRFTKLHLQDPFISELRLWLLRIAGSQRLQKILDSHHYNSIMKVPKKWIYPLPLHPAATGLYPKYFILIEEDMRIVGHETNKDLYRTAMTPEILKAFYIVLKESGFYDSIYIDNNPFSLDGRIAFVDTEEYDRKPVLFEQILPHLSSSMQPYWKKLMNGEL